MIFEWLQSLAEQKRQILKLRRGGTRKRLSGCDVSFLFFFVHMVLFVPLSQPPLSWPAQLSSTREGRIGEGRPGDHVNAITLLHIIN